MNRKDKIKKRAAMLALCCLLVFTGVTASAAGVLPAGLLIGDEEGISVSADGDYFIDAAGLAPSDVIQKNLTIRNLDEGAPFTLHMTAQPMETSGPIDLLEHVHLVLRLDGAVLYSGRLRGNEGADMINHALELGRYATGDARQLSITLIVTSDETLPWKEKSEAFIGWHFYAVKGEQATPPKTGVAGQTALYIATLGMAALTVLLLVINKKRKKDNGHANKGQ